MPGGSRLIAAGLLVFVGLGCGSDRNPPAENAGGAETGTKAKAASLEEASPETSNVVSPDDPRREDIGFLRSQPPSAERDIALGTYFLKRDQEDSALVHYQAATRYDPKSPRPWNFVGITLGRMARYDEAEKAYRTAIELDPFYPKTHVNLGNIYLHKNQLEEAINAYLAATRIDSTDFLTWLNLGLAYERKQGKRSGPYTSETDRKAIMAYFKAIDCDDTRPEPWERLGWIYYDQGFYKEARKRWAEAVKRDPSREDLRDNIQRLQAWADSTNTQ